MQTAASQLPTCWFLFDNGSLRPESTLSLRQLAANLATASGERIEAVSLLHSSKVPADKLGGEPAQLLEPALIRFFTENPTGEAGLLPVFFGPSGALTEYLPARLTALKARFVAARFRVSPWLVDIADVNDCRIAAILADRVRDTISGLNWKLPRVVLVDHGSPQKAVAEVRDHLGRQLEVELQGKIGALGVASMERREGADYAFNEPLLATLLRTPPFDQGDVVVALQFLSPGRHAGSGGDIAEICAQAEAASDGRLRTVMTAPIASDKRLVSVLMDRMAQAVVG